MFTAGVCLSASIFMIILSSIPRLTYDDGMIKCKLEPQLCEKVFTVYQAEEALNKLKDTKSKKLMSMVEDTNSPVPD